MRDAHRLGHVDDRDDDVRPRRDRRRARRAHAPIRELQDETHGFRAFISWTFQDDGNRLGAVSAARDDADRRFDYLLTQAVSRIYLDNIDHIQS